MFVAKIYPNGSARGMRAFSDEFHQINCWDEHSDDYQDIFKVNQIIKNVLL